MSTYLMQIAKLTEQIRQADAIVVGGGSGLSSAGGYDYYHWSPALLEALRPFYDYYSFKSPFESFYHCFSTPEEQWAYYAAYIHAIRQFPTGQPYLDLQEILKDKSFFVLTTNVDMQFHKVFPPEQICAFQGDFAFFQCGQPCHDAIYDNQEIVEQLYDNTTNLKVPTELIPRCPKCGWKMVPWVRDDTFLEGTEWKKAVKQYYAFLQQWLIDKPDSRVLLLELGVGEMTPNIIKIPFWEMTAKNKNVSYICINQKPSTVPAHISDRSMYLSGDIKTVLHDILLQRRMTHGEK